jgi:hypothetical protein
VSFPMMTIGSTSLMNSISDSLPFHLAKNASFPAGSMDPG